MEGGKQLLRVVFASPMLCKNANHPADHDQMKGIPAMKRTALLAASVIATATPALAHGSHSEKLTGLLHVVIHNPGILVLAALTLALVLVLTRKAFNR
jgi:hypothetical protein